MVAIISLIITFLDPQISKSDLTYLSSTARNFFNADEHVLIELDINYSEITQNYMEQHIRDDKFPARFTKLFLINELKNESKMYHFLNYLHTHTRVFTAATTRRRLRKNMFLNGSPSLTSSCTRSTHVIPALFTNFYENKHSENVTSLLKLARRCKVTFLFRIQKLINALVSFNCF